jgi:Peptidase A4 family
MSVSAAHARGLSFEAQSTNWSGYAATTGTYTSVSASWTQPAGTCSRGDQYAAFWVGLDGYNSNSVEQTGSEVDCVGRTAQYYAWYEMYPSASVTYPNTVRAGDHFTASVTYIGSNQYTLKISDTTQNWTQSTTQSLSGAPRSSAEVIAEAPCCTASGGILPLTDFGTMSFTGSTANGSAIGNAGGLTEIIMIDNSGRDKDTISSLSGGENFSATWLRSN